MQRRRKLTERRVLGNVPKAQLRKTVGFAVRIHEGRHAAGQIKSELRELGLNKKYDAIFVKLDDEGIGIFVFFC